eukprot:3881463-Rhodomonas_salina.2
MAARPHKGSRRAFGIKHVRGCLAQMATCRRTTVGELQDEYHPPLVLILLEVKAIVQALCVQRFALSFLTVAACRAVLRVSVFRGLVA